jgi:uncharacterized protein (TIGR03435 family)
MRPVAVSVCLVFLCFAAFAWQAPGEPRFEVAWIRPSDPNPSSPMFIGMSADGAMVRYSSITLLDCIRGAYRVRDFQIAGPDWITKDRFEISAKLPARASIDQVPEMLQALLAERFKLEIRREMRPASVYALVVGNGGAKLKPAEVKSDSDSAGPKALGPDGKPREPMMYAFLPGGGISITAPAASVPSLVWILSKFTARPVVDKTDLNGQYEFKLAFAAERNGNTNPGFGPGPDSAAATEPLPSVFDSVKQYGLRLEARNAPVEMLMSFMSKRRRRRTEAFWA